MLIWRPNTCKCVLGYTSGTENSAANFEQTIEVCPEHQNLSGVDVHNAALQKSRDTMAQLQTVCDSLGVPFGSVEWHYDENGVLQFDMAALETKVNEFRLVQALAADGVLESKKAQLDTVNASKSQ